MPIHLYAEHLVNIRTLSIQASLSTVSNKTTSATLAADGSYLSLVHEGESATIKLPVSIPGGRNAATLTLPAAPAKELSFRISLSEKAGSELLATGNTDATNVIPWTAVSLSKNAQMSCAKCSSVILLRGKVITWKDLPSENWAEMMDFWHCHRPDVPHEENHTAPGKGYASNSRLALEPGVGMIDPVDLILSAADCQNMVVLPSSDSKVGDILRCNSCQSNIGQVHTSSGGYKLRKSHLAMSSSASSMPASYGLDKWLACHLLSSAETHGVRKFNVHAFNYEDALKVWLFTPDTTISSSAASVPEPVRALKILWMDSVATASGEGALTREALSEGDLELPPDEITWLREHLIRSAGLLPEGARKFQSWAVGLLPRFSLTDMEDEYPGQQQPVIQLPDVPDLENKMMLAELTS